MSAFKSSSEYREPLIAFLFSLGIAFGAYVLLPLFLPHKPVLPAEDRVLVAEGYSSF